MMFLSAAILLVGLSLANAEDCKKDFLKAGATVRGLCKHIQDPSFSLNDLVQCKATYTLKMADAVKTCAKGDPKLVTRDGLVNAICKDTLKVSTDLVCCIMSQESIGTEYENQPNKVAEICRKCILDPVGGRKPPK